MLSSLGLSLLRTTRARFHLAGRRLLSSASFEEPSRPGLFYHLVSSRRGPIFAVSLLEATPWTPTSATVIGSLPTTSDDGANSDATFEDFIPNPAFIEVLNASVKRALESGADEGLAMQAKLVYDGWLHVNDERNEAAKTGDRIGSPDDIVGSVCVKEGKILPETFSPMPSYRVCTPDGVVKLSDPMMKHLLQVLREAHDAESEEL
ncbi:hypothetical protein AURDEDRAFT_83047 [Auricularia subglabra TFB-10046 SS5]|nr:hypothetical protein AURDEDRAFT_83047 [Auricularia subglabra TFB-10046 SS5]